MEIIMSLLLIIGIDLALAGDNAIVIGLAAKHLPTTQQRKAIIIGTLGAVLIRACAAVLVVLLIQIQWLHLVGGLLLVFMSYQFLVSNENHSEVKKGKTLWSAVRTIIIADALMGLDNVLAIAGAAGHNYILIIIGLLISVPLVMLGSSLFIKLMDRHPGVVFAGSGLLALTAGKMIVAEPIIHSWFPEEYYAWMVVLGIGLCVVSAGWVKLRVLRRRENQCMES